MGLTFIPAAITRPNNAIFFSLKRNLYQRAHDKKERPNSNISALIYLKSTEVEDDILFVEINVPEYGATGYWELYVKGNEVTGYAFDMFEIVGTISR